MNNKGTKYINKEIKRVNNILDRSFMQSDLKKTVDEITGTNGWIIGYLAENQNKDIFQRDIEEVFSVRRSTVSNIIQLMEKKGLIKREYVNSDARLKKIVLTEKSLKLHKMINKYMTEQEEKIRKDISDEELEIFFNVLEKIVNNVNKE